MTTDEDVSRGESSTTALSLRPWLYVVEMTILSSLVLNPLVISIFRNSSQLKYGAMGGLPVLVAGGIVVAFGYAHRKALWTVGITTGLGYALVSSALMANGVDSRPLLASVWAGMLSLAVLVVYKSYWTGGSDPARTKRTE